MAVYRKSLKLSASERRMRSLGEITNLSSIDAQRLQGKSQIYMYTCMQYNLFA